jgi:hypothetical protein
MFWFGAICLGRGVLWIFFVLSVSYVLQHCMQPAMIARLMWCLHMLLVAESSMEPAALLACINPRSLPYFLFYID